MAFLDSQKHTTDTLPQQLSEAKVLIKLGQAGAAIHKSVLIS
jgi:hypothetical protein